MVSKLNANRLHFRLERKQHDSVALPPLLKLKRWEVLLFRMADRLWNFSFKRGRCSLRLCVRIAVFMLLCLKIYIKQQTSLGTEMHPWKHPFFFPRHLPEALLFTHFCSIKMNNRFFTRSDGFTTVLKLSRKAHAGYGANSFQI